MGFGAGGGGSDISRQFVVNCQTMFWKLKNIKKGVIRNLPFVQCVEQDNIK